MRLLRLEDEALSVRDLYPCSTYSSWENDQGAGNKVTNLAWHLLPYPTFKHFEFLMFPAPIYVTREVTVRPCISFGDNSSWRAGRRCLK